MGQFYYSLQVIIIPHCKKTIILKMMFGIHSTKYKKLILFIIKIHKLPNKMDHSHKTYSGKIIISIMILIICKKKRKNLNFNIKNFNIKKILKNNNQYKYNFQFYRNKSKISTNFINRNTNRFSKIKKYIIKIKMNKLL